MDCFRSVAKILSPRTLRLKSICKDGNIISNERPDLFKISKTKGGAHVGIGSTQNLDLAARNRSDIILIIDKALDVVNNLDLLRKTLRCSDSYKDFCRTLLKAGDISFPGFDRHSFREGSVRLNKNDYLHLKRLADNNRIGIINGNIFDMKTANYINNVLSKTGFKISSAYFSNVEDASWTYKVTDHYYKVLRTLQWAKDLTIYRTFLGEIHRTKYESDTFKLSRTFFYHQTLFSKYSRFFDLTPPSSWREILDQMVSLAKLQDAELQHKL